MGLREQINQHPALVTRATFAVIVLALIVIVYQQREFGTRPRPGGLGPAGHTDQPVGDEAAPHDPQHDPPGTSPGHAADAAPKAHRTRPQPHRKTTPESIA